MNRIFLEKMYLLGGCENKNLTMLKSFSEVEKRKK